MYREYQQMLLNIKYKLPTSLTILCQMQGAPQACPCLYDRLCPLLHCSRTAAALLLSCRRRPLETGLDDFVQFRVQLPSLAACEKRKPTLPRFLIFPAFSNCFSVILKHIGSLIHTETNEIRSWDPLWRSKVLILN